MQADYTTFAIGTGYLFSFWVAMQTFMAKRSKRILGPAALLKRLLTHSQAVASVLTEVGAEAVDEVRERYPRHLKEAKGKW